MPVWEFCYSSTLSSTVVYSLGPLLIFVVSGGTIFLVVVRQPRVYTLSMLWLEAQRCKALRVVLCIEPEL